MHPSVEARCEAGYIDPPRSEACFVMVQYHESEGEELVYEEANSCCICLAANGGHSLMSSSSAVGVPG